MPGKIPEIVRGYRITHYKNLSFILRNGLYCPASDNRDPDYINIGKKDIIQKREGKDIKVGPGGRIHDYVSFYFGPLSPMLYSIHMGNSDTDCSQSEIVYIVTSIPALSNANVQYVFTSGQAIMQLSTQHDDIKDLDKIDWDIIKAQYWFDRPPQYVDRQRRRMAELLVYQHVPIACIEGLVVQNAKAKDTVEAMVDEAGVLMRVAEFSKWYY
jgi:hypothetical protein